MVLIEAIIMVWFFILGIFAGVWHLSTVCNMIYARQAGVWIPDDLDVPFPAPLALALLVTIPGIAFCVWGILAFICLVW